MKKRLPLLAMVSLLTLAGCADVNQITEKGNQVIVKLGDKSYTANDLFEDYTNTSSGAPQYYNAVYDVLIRNVQDKTNAINNTVETKIENFIQSANDAAAENGTSSSTEISAALEAEGVDTLDELEQVYYLEAQKTAYQNKYYDDNVNEALLEEFINYYAPYHVRHILVKLSEGCTGSLYDEKISKSDAENLADVVARLASGKETFGVIAQSTAANGDSGSAAIYGDVGVMSTLTSFVSEFKFGIYQFDQLYNNAEGAAENVQAFNTRQDSRKINNDDYSGSHLIPYADSSDEMNLLKDNVNFIEYKRFADLKKVAHLDTSDSPNATINGNETYYPRNYIFNNYLNNHALGFITRGTDETVASSPRFQDLEGVTDTSNPADDILCDEVGNPILVTKADADYHGIHFIIVEKSPFVDIAGNDKTLLQELKSYWDTTTYSTSTDVSNIDSYVTFIDSTRSEYIERADTLKTNIKQFDNNISFRIYEQALKEAKEKYDIEFGEGIEELINKYISSQRGNAAYSAKESYEESWESYIYKIQSQIGCKDLKVKADDIRDLFTEYNYIFED